MSTSSTRRKRFAQLSSLSIVLLWAATAVVAAKQPATPDLAADENPAGVMAANDCLVANTGFCYRNYSGLVFHGRNDSDEYEVHGQDGCIRPTRPGTEVTMPLMLPDNALIQVVRLYYYDTDPDGDIRLWLTEYPGDGSYRDLVSISSQGGNGYGTAVSHRFYYPVWTVSGWDIRGLALTVRFSAGSGQQRLCGVRVAWKSDADQQQDPPPHAPDYNGPKSGDDLFKDGFETP